MVLRVDKEKGYIDLSKRRVSPEDIAAAEERYNKSKMVCPGRITLHGLCRLCSRLIYYCACRCTASCAMLRRPPAQIWSSSMSRLAGPCTSCMAMPLMLSKAWFRSQMRSSSGL